MCSGKRRNKTSQIVADRFVFQDSDKKVADSNVAESFEDFCSATSNQLTKSSQESIANCRTVDPRIFESDNKASSCQTAQCKTCDALAIYGKRQAMTAL
ncbi:unnamed protein product [Bursaphelenchus okinawaensis]|uniref:Uncharacterized protein n=1 Tax=Bursaphelenchus okinawaensis TaxID=465554 RepID=A0A811KWJ7_9BILA|nr:unnamed protein product [Bursaphelenchus okinawaensis]CAG9113327.1 unnamed protein product [Bursaphelenchus okinawaensis]